MDIRGNVLVQVTGNTENTNELAARAFRRPSISLIITESDDR